jgi:DNA-binding NtrC family response regulator
MKIAVIDDDKWYLEFLDYQLSRDGNDEIFNFQVLDEFLKTGVKMNPDVVLLDYSLPGVVGDRAFHSIKSILPETEIIIVSGQDNVSVAINLMRMGAYDYVVKDESTADLILRNILKIRENKNLKEEVKFLRSKVSESRDINKNLIGDSKIMQDVKTLISKATESTINVSIHGETGTGKEVVAKLIHENSNRKGEFIAINVSAIPDNLVESELFGYNKGAFTGAISNKKGKFLEAHKGTIFLDEIGDMSENMQVKLLRALEERELVPLGTNKKMKFDVRVISASHKNLAELVEKGKFRQDLYFRLIGLPVNLPPLRNRGNDLDKLSKHFISNYSRANNQSIKSLSDEARNKLKSYNFPGNVRELKSIIELAVILSNGEVITSGDIQFRGGKLNTKGLVGADKSLQDYINEIVEHYIQIHDGNVVNASKALGIGKSTVYRYLKEINS